MNSLLVFSLLLAGPLLCNAAAGIKFAPFYDTFLENRKLLSDVAKKTGQLDYHLAFALGGIHGCKPMWGGVYEIDDPVVLDEIKAVKAMGGNMIVATGGALGPYLEHLCGTVDALLGAYKEVLDVVGTNHLDIDVEAPIALDVMNGALAQLQQERPDVTISFTLMIQGEDYGLTPALGTDVLIHAKGKGVRVDIVNAMTMEYGASSPDFGDSVINTAKSVLRQMAEIYPEKSQTELKQMLGVTPMIGRNFNGNVFQIPHAHKLVEWANQEQIGQLAFWSIERDNGGCQGTVSPYCSGTPQEEFEFTKIFQGFK